MKGSVGLNINHDLDYSTSKALKKASAELNEDPTIILYFTGSHKGGSKTYDRAMSIIQKNYPEVPMVGCSGVGIAHHHDYGLKGAAIMMLSDIVAQTHVIKRFRILNRLKSRKALSLCDMIIKKNKNLNTSFLFFPPGLGFPKFMVNLLNHRIEGFNPFFILNNRIWKNFPIFSSFSGKITSFLMDLLGIGISYSCAWPLFTSLFSRNIQFTGSFGTDALTMNKSYQFYDYQAYKDSLAFVSLSSSELEFMSHTDSGATPLRNKELEIDSYLDGGFIPRINGEWGANALLKLYDMEQTPEILEEITQRYFYYLPHRPLCILDGNKNINLYGLAINPNLKHGLLTAPNQLAKKLKTKNSEKLKAYLTCQSAITIEETLDLTLETLNASPIKFSLFFDCANRAMIIGDRFDQYVSKFKNHLGTTPYLIILSGGEINSQQFPIVNFSLISSLAYSLISPHSS